MLKKRLIAGLNISNKQLVQSIGFSTRLPIGRPEITAEFLSRWGADEICLIDIDASKKSQCISTEIIERVSKVITVPLLVGGGIKDIVSVHSLFKSGADKILLGMSILNNIKFIDEIAQQYGNQAVVICLDIKKIGDDYYFISNNSSEKIKDLSETMDLLVKSGAGEIVLRAVHRDGMANGFEVDLLKMIKDVSVPVLLSGGAGSAKDIFSALKSPNLSGVIVGNMFLHSEHSISTVKRYLCAQNLEVRTDKALSYEMHNISEDGRVSKNTDEYLETIRFKHFSDEVI